MIGRLAGVVALACWCLALCAGSAAADIPPGPRLAFTEIGDTTFRLVSSDPAGGERQVIAGAKGFLPFPFSRPSWSGDGSRIAFTALERVGKNTRVDVYTAAPDGNERTRVPNTRNGIGAVLAPDGRTLAFAREREHETEPRRGKASTYRSVSIWLLNIDTGKVSRLTPWRNGLSAYPSSFSPDGSTLAISREWRDSYSAVAIRLDGSGETVLAHNAGEPIYSPDGSRLALTTIGRPSYWS